MVAMSTRPSDGIGERLRKYRLLSGLSAQRLSDRMGGALSRGVIANIESGAKRDVTVDELIQLAFALDIPPVVLALPVEEPGEFVKLYQMGDPDDMLVERSHLLTRWFMGDDIYPRDRSPRVARSYARSILRAIDRFKIAQRDFTLAVESEDPGRIEEAASDLEAARADMAALGMDTSGVLFRQHANEENDG